MLLAPVRPLRIANLPTWQEAAIPQGRWLKHNEQKPLVLNRANVDKKGKYQTNCASLPQWPAPAYAHKCHYCLMCRAAPLSHIQIKQHYMSTGYEQHEQNVEGAAIDNKSRRQPFFLSRTRTMHLFKLLQASSLIQEQQGTDYHGFYDC